jgi:GNAT superfamily N-acetyltransferase
VAPAEWRLSRDLRLASLQDPVAQVAFARSYAEESAHGDDVWRKRASGVGAQQFVAVEAGAGGAWVGMAVVVVDRPDYVSVNAVYLRPEVRGSGLADRLLSVAVDWAWEYGADRLHLWVHEKNPRAEAFYRRLGFARTGRTMAYPLDPADTEYELALSRT